ncbi:MAG: HAMP domain-containing histidine kinase, partial [Nitrospiraceae bacterium]|nr:HAMP domain-containing histidine kinase [Nitrospiraceae bacterium]
KILRTGDEFEDLSRSFSDMAGKLSDYHDSLNDKIKAATIDIEDTNRKLTEANALLNEMNMRKSDFIARASHELRTPLTSIKGAMDFISAKLSFIPQQYNIDKSSITDIQSFLDIINKNSERLIRMVNDMLDLERIEAGSSELFFTNANISALISETVSYFQIEAAKKGVHFAVQAATDITADIDEDRIRQVMINLISNALKFSPENGQITITAASGNGSVTICVSDQGPGIKPEHHEKIFEKFFKLGTKKDGSGLGLAVCKSIIEAHNGSIGVVSSDSGGAVFHFTIPVSQNGAESIIKEMRGYETGLSSGSRAQT